MVKWKRIDYSCTDSERKQFIHSINESLPKHYVKLETCNRVEFFWGNGSIHPDLTRHLFSLTAGLKSALIGEKNIQGQVKSAYAAALQQDRTSKSLNMLFQKALFVGKKIRTETGIDAGAVGHAQAAYQLFCDIFKQRQESLFGKKVLIIGVNKLSRDFLTWLVKGDLSLCWIANRSYEKAADLAAEFNCRAFHFDKLLECIKQADIIFSCTSAPHFIINSNTVQESAGKVFIDLAVPADINPEIGTRKGAVLYSIKDIEHYADTVQKVRFNEKRKAEILIEEEVSRFHEYFENSNKQQIK